MEILGDAFLKYSVGLFLHYKMTNDPASEEYRGRSHGEGDLSSARSRVVSNRNLCQVAEALLLPQVGEVGRWPVPGPHTWPPRHGPPGHLGILYWRSGHPGAGEGVPGDLQPLHGHRAHGHHPQGAMRVERVELDCTWLPPGFSCAQVTSGARSALAL